MKKSFVIDVRPVRNEKLSPKEYLKLLEESPTLVDRAEFVPPKPGSNSFGLFAVRYSRPRYRDLVNC